MENTLNRLLGFFDMKDENGIKVSEEESWIDAYGTSRIMKAVFERNEGV